MTTKQEEIREGIEKTICSHCDDVGDWKEGQTVAEAQEYCRKRAICAYCTDLQEAIQKYEVSQGVVIKVGEITEKMPSSATENTRYYAVGKDMAMVSTERTSEIYKAFKDMDYVAVERLIE